MVAHAIINIPMTPFWQGVALAAFVIGALITTRTAVAVVKHVFASASVTACIALGLLGTGWAIAAQRIQPLQFAAAAMVVLAVGLEFVDRRRTRAPTEAQQQTLS